MQVCRVQHARFAVSVLSGKSQNPSSALQQLKDCDAQVRAVILSRGARPFALIHARSVVQEVYFAGISLEGAILANVLDLRAALPGVDVFVIEDACTSSSPAASAAAMKRFEAERIPVIHLDGPELALLPEAAPDLPVALPVMLPPADETFESLLARLSKDRTLGLPIDRAGSLGLRIPQTPLGAAAAPLSARSHALVSRSPTGARILASQRSPRGASFSRESIVHDREEFRRSLRRVVSCRPAPVGFTFDSPALFGAFRQLDSVAEVPPSDATDDTCSAGSFTARSDDRLLTPAALTAQASVASSSAKVVEPPPLISASADEDATSTAAHSPRELPRTLPIVPASTSEKRSDGGPRRHGGLNFLAVAAAVSLRARAASLASQLGPDVLPPTPADRLISVALYGRAADMHASLVRYGPVTIDVRVEPLGMNCLHIAIKRGSKPLVRVLLEHGADANLPTSNGSTPLLLACRFNSTPIADLLLSWSSLHATSLSAHETEQRMTPLMWAALHGNLTLVKSILSKSPSMRVDPVALARAANRYGQTPAMLAAAAGPARMGCGNGERGLWAISSHEQVASAKPTARKGVVSAGRAPELDNTVPVCGLDDKSHGVLGGIALELEVGAERADNFVDHATLAEQLRQVGSCSRLVSWATPPTLSERRDAITQAAAVVNALLALEDTAANRAILFGGSAVGAKYRSMSGWSTLHHAARSGVLAFVNWGLLLPLTPRQRFLSPAQLAMGAGGDLPAPLVDINAPVRPPDLAAVMAESIDPLGAHNTASARAPMSSRLREPLPLTARGPSTDGAVSSSDADLVSAPSALHLAAWNGQAGVLAALLLGPWQSGRPNVVAAHVRVNARLALAGGPWPGVIAVDTHASRSHPTNPSGAVLADFGDRGGHDLLSLRRAQRDALSTAATALDLALMKHLTQCARVLCRAGAYSVRAGQHTGTSSMKVPMAMARPVVPRERRLSIPDAHSDAASAPVSSGSVDEFLFRSVLLGDGVTAERLLRADENGLHVTLPLLELCSRLKYPETCTATFAPGHHPIGQWMYECTSCGQAVCLVCRDACHPQCDWDAAAASLAAQAPSSAAVPHSLRALGFLPAASCACRKQTCRAISSIDPREAAGLTWVPNPIDTRAASSLNMSPGTELGLLVDKLAWNSHEVRV